MWKSFQQTYDCRMYRWDSQMCRMWGNLLEQNDFIIQEMGRLPMESYIPISGKELQMLWSSISVHLKVLQSYCIDHMQCMHLLFLHQFHWNFRVRQIFYILIFHWRSLDEMNCKWIWVFWPSSQNHKWQDWQWKHLMECEVILRYIESVRKRKRRDGRMKQ